jgi:hypothetical protein
MGTCISAIVYSREKRNSVGQHVKCAVLLAWLLITNFWLGYERGRPVRWSLAAGVVPGTCVRTADGLAKVAVYDRRPAFILHSRAALSL